LATRVKRMLRPGAAHAFALLYSKQSKRVQ
jgi:hypothetical protein